MHLSHPGYETEYAYQATLAKETWSENWRASNSNHLGGEVDLKFGVKLLNAMGFSASGKAAKDRHVTAESEANAPYPIVISTPDGWQIGTELGDPRDPQGTLPVGLEHCLNGEYLSGRNGEDGNGFEEKNGKFALCELIIKSGANDNHISATLFGSSDSLRVVFARLDSATLPASSIASRNEQKDREDELRKAFIEICIQRAKDASKTGARTESMISGEFYLSHHEVVGPKIPPRASEQSMSKHDGQAATVRQKT